MLSVLSWFCCKAWFERRSNDKRGKLCGLNISITCDNLIDGWCTTKWTIGADHHFNRSQNNGFLFILTAPENGLWSLTVEMTIKIRLGTFVIPPCSLVSLGTIVKLRKPIIVLILGAEPSAIVICQTVLCKNKYNQSTAM